MPTATFFNLPEAKRHRIREAVYRVYTTMPFERVTTTAIVTEADIPRGSFYQYFADLDDLYSYFVTEATRDLVDKMYDAGIADFWFEGSDTFNYQALEYYLKKKEGIIGKEKNDFILTIYNAPEQLRNRICINNAVQWSTDKIRAHMRASYPHVSDRDLDIAAFTYSMGDLMEKKFLDWKGWSLEEAPYFSARMLQLLFSGLRRLEEKGREAEETAEDSGE